MLERVDTNVLRYCHDRISQVIDVEQSRALKKVVVKEGYSDELDYLQQQWDGMENILEDAAKATVHELPDLIEVSWPGF